MLFKIYEIFIDMLGGLAANEHVRIALLAMLAAQVLKIFFYYLRHRKMNFRVFVRPSGMPSSHTSMVLALTSSVGLSNGWDSGIFAIALVFSIIVMYDAAGVRQSAGKQAKVLNLMMEDLFTKKKINEMRLKEFLGHTPLEVISGALLGIFFAFAYHLIYNI